MDAPNPSYDAFLDFCKKCLNRNKKIYDRLYKIKHKNTFYTDKINKLKEAKSRVKIFKNLINTRNFFDRIFYKYEAHYITITRKSGIIVNIISAHAKSYGEFCIYAFPFLSSRFDDYPKIIEEALVNVEILDSGRVKYFNMTLLAKGNASDGSEFNNHYEDSDSDSDDD